MPSPRDLDLFKLAERETDPSQVHKFSPITRGPAIAIIGIILMATLGLLLFLLRKRRHVRPS